MIKSKTEKIVARLLANAAEMMFGTVSVAIKLHSGRVVEITYTTAEQTKEPKSELEKET